MNIHEYQAKEVLRSFGVVTGKGAPAFTVEEAVKVAETQPGPVWVVKAQIHAGGRGKGGGVKVVKSVADVKTESQRILGMTLITPQTAPQGKLVQRLYIEEGTAIARELYLSILVDRAVSRIAALKHLPGALLPILHALQEEFGQPGQQKAGCGFPVAHLLVLFNAVSGLILDAIASPLRTHDMSQASRTHARLEEGDVLIGDTAFGTYAHFALLLQGKRHGLFPAHQLRIVDFKPGRAWTKPGRNNGLPTSRWIRSLGKTDQLVEWFKPKNRPNWMTDEQYAQLPESIIVRETRRTIRRKGFQAVTLTIVTTLLDPIMYPAEELFELRRRRWDVETNLRHLKITLKMDVMRCQSVAGVRKELAMFAIAYNLVRTIMMQAARRQGVPVSRISFIDALTWLRTAGPDSELPALLVNPQRPGRVEPRVNKRRHKEYDRLNKPRDEMRKTLKNKEKSA